MDTIVIFRSYLPWRASEDWTVNLKTPKHSFWGHRASRKTSNYFQSPPCTGAWFVSLAMDRVRYHLGLHSPRFPWPNTSLPHAPKTSALRRPIKTKNPVITASERRSLDGDDHVSKCHNENVALVGKCHCVKHALTAVEDRNMKCNEKK